MFRDAIFMAMINQMAPAIELVGSTPQKATSGSIDLTAGCHNLISEGLHMRHEHCEHGSPLANGRVSALGVNSSHWRMDDT
jgi:hypothetical protein